MIKSQVTRQWLKQAFPKIYACPYCSLQTLLKFEAPFYYLTRKEGWAADVYVIDDVAIVTGYAPIGKEITYHTIKHLEHTAQLLENDNIFDNETLKDLYHTLLSALVRQLREGTVQ